VHTRTWILAASAAVIATLVWVAVTPVSAGSREQVFEIPNGTWARRMAGEKIETLPDHIYLTVGVRDVLVLKNRDAVPQTFGPTLMMPGQSFTLPFERAAEYQFACTAHASGQMTIVVDPFPATPWARISWRARKLIRRL
jgi:plastocyanin